MYTLGINAAFHDSAACLVKDGIVLAAAEEERFTGIKHGKRPIPFSTYELPFHAIDYCLKEAGIALPDLDHIAYSFDPSILLNGRGRIEYVSLPMRPTRGQSAEGWDSPWDPLFLAMISHAPGLLLDNVPFHLERRFRRTAEEPPYTWHYVEHHIAHAASAFYPSPFTKAAVMTLDGRGERATTTYFLGEGLCLDRIGEVTLPHSLGLLYEEVTKYLGFLHSADEYKVMALASYGEPLYADYFRDVVSPARNGTYTVRDPQFTHIFGPPRQPGDRFVKKHFDIAQSLQVVLEERVLELAEWLHEKTGTDNLCMAGGVALNCVMNSYVRDHGPFKNVWVQPAAGDAGTALGAALWVDAQQRHPSENHRTAKREYAMEHAYLGPSYSDHDIYDFLRSAKLPFREMESIADEVAALLVQDNVIGWFQHRMEFGPRALGSRSIVASPLNASMQARLNEIKDREDFRPVAPVVLEEEADQWFVNPGVSPFMLFVDKVREDKAPFIPAVRHVDGTARIQTIRREQNPRYYDLLKAFKAKTGVPVLVNTSFNTRGKPIVCSPRDAVECFISTPLDALVLGPFLLQKHPD